MSRAAKEAARRGAAQGLDAQGIVVRCPSTGELAEEAPLAYKDVDRVVDVVHQARIARKVAQAGAARGGQGMNHHR